MGGACDLGGAAYALCKVIQNSTLRGKEHVQREMHRKLFQQKSGSLNNVTAMEAEISFWI